MSEEAKRDNSAKPALSMLPKVFKAAVARVMSFGAAKYGRSNYLKGHRVTGLLDSIERHIDEIKDGQDIDAESGESHWAHIAANCLMALHQQQLGTLKDDRLVVSDYVPAPAARVEEPKYQFEPDTYYEVLASGGMGTDYVIARFTTADLAEKYMKNVAGDWPTFVLYVREVSSDAGHQETA